MVDSDGAGLNLKILKFTTKFWSMKWKADKYMRVDCVVTDDPHIQCIYHLCVCKPKNFLLCYHHRMIQFIRCTHVFWKSFFLIVAWDDDTIKSNDRWSHSIELNDTEKNMNNK